MKTNFKTQNKDNNQHEKPETEMNKNLTPEEFENFIIKSGAKGSFMVYRSKKKEDELGIDEL